MIQKNRKFLSITLIIIFLVTALAACGNNVDNSKAAENVVAKVNGEEIYYESYKKNFSIVERIYNERYTENIWSQEIKGKTVLAIVKGQILDKLITEELIRQEAEKKEITFDKAKVEETYNSFKERLAQDEELKKFYEENNLDEEFIRKQISMELLVSEYQKALLEEIELNDEKLEELIKDYVVKVRARQILIKDEALAKEVLAKVKSGEDFGALAREYSEDPGSKEKDGDLGYLSRDMMWPEVKEAAFSMKVGEISDIIKSQNGYYIIKLEDKKTIEDLKEEMSQEEIATEKEKAKAEIVQDKITEKINELKANANIEKFEENLK